MNKLRSQLEQNLGWIILLVLLAGCLIVHPDFFRRGGWRLAFSFISIFLGPTLLAVGFRLVEEWNLANHDVPATEKP